MIAGVLLASAMMSFGAEAHALQRLDTTSIRAFVREQNRAWNARDFEHFYGMFGPNARLVIVSDKQGDHSRSVRSLAEDRRESERFFATTHARIQESDTIESIAIAPDGRHARVRVREETRVARGGKTRRLRATTEQELGILHGRIVSLELTEYDNR
jgi:hypothetical protein